MIAKIAEIVSSHATRPDRSVGIDLRTYPAGVTVNHLILLRQDSFNQFVVLDPESFRKFCHARELFTFHVSNEAVDCFGISFRARRDGQSNGIEFHSGFCNLGDELIGPRLVGIGNQFVQVADTENRHNRMNPYRQVG